MNTSQPQGPTDPSEPHVPQSEPSAPHLAPPPAPESAPAMSAPPAAGPAPYSAAPVFQAPAPAGAYRPGAPQAAPPTTGPIPVLAPPRDTHAPPPVGLAFAGVGLALLCLSFLIPRITVEDPEGEFSFYSYQGLYGGTSYSLDTPTVVLALALLAAVGLSTHRNPAFRWPTRLGAVGAAALTAAIAYHPVTVLRQAVESYEDSAGYDEFAATGASEIEIAADAGIYVAAIAVALLALSAFFMHFQTSRQPRPVPPPPAPAGWPGAQPTITVDPG